VIGDIGAFYADLLDRRGVVALSALGELSGTKQQLLCKLADEDDLRINPPKRERIIAFLRGTRDQAATQCLREFGNNWR
jgi:hypothetical protein